MNATKLGRQLRKLRIDAGERLYDLAGGLGVKSSFLSAVELGKKAAPEEMLQRIAARYQMDEVGRKELYEAARESVPAVKVDLKGKSPGQRELAVAFARTFANLNEEEVRKVMGIIKDSGVGNDGTVL